MFRLAVVLCQRKVPGGFGFRCSSFAAPWHFEKLSVCWETHHVSHRIKILFGNASHLSHIHALNLLLLRVRQIFEPKELFRHMCIDVFVPLRQSTQGFKILQDRHLLYINSLTGCVPNYIAVNPCYVFCDHPIYIWYGRDGRNPSLYMFLLLSLLSDKAKHGQTLILKTWWTKTDLLSDCISLLGTYSAHSLLIHLWGCVRHYLWLWEWQLPTPINAPVRTGCVGHVSRWHSCGSKPSGTSCPTIFASLYTGCMKAKKNGFLRTWSTDW
jgi:hypothetical protein